MISIEFLKELGIEGDAADAVLAEAEKDAAAHKDALEALKGELESKGAASRSELLGQIGALKESVRRYEEAEAENKAKAAAMERFEKAAGEREFINSITKDGVFAEFRSAIEGADGSKTDLELFNELINGQSNLFREQQNVPTVVASSLSGAGLEMSDSDIREIMGLSAQ